MNSGSEERIGADRDPSELAIRSDVNMLAEPRVGF